MVPEKPWHGDRLSGREVRRGYPAVDVGHVAHVGQHHDWNGDPSVPDQALLDAQVPGGPASALNDPGCQCVVSWRLGVSNVVTSRDAGWVGFPEGEVLSVLPVGAVSGLSEFAFEVDVYGGGSDTAISGPFVRGGDSVGIPAWVWALAVGWSGVLVGTGARLYRTRRSWMRKYREGQLQR